VRNLGANAAATVATAAYRTIRAGTDAGTRSASALAHNASHLLVGNQHDPLIPDERATAQTWSASTRNWPTTRTTLVVVDPPEQWVAADKLAAEQPDTAVE